MIHLEGLTIRVPRFTVRVNSLHLPPGAFFCLLGPTGSGKSLILETIAGLIKPATGRVILNGQDRTHQPPEQRGLGIVYQDSALFPNLTVRQNICFGLRYHPKAKNQAQTFLPWLIKVLDIGDLLERNVTTLSGGECKRTALARALAVQPRVLLLDEPLSALDPNFRDEIRLLLKNLHRTLGLTVFMVTHDFTEAIFLADRVGILRQGKFEQHGSAENVFRRPATEFVARFTGMRNVFPSHYRDGHIEFCGLKISCPAEETHPTLVGLRPEDLIVRRNVTFPDTYQVLRGRLLGISPAGFQYEARIQAGGQELMGIVDHRTLLESHLTPGDEVMAGFDPALLHTFGRLAT